ncbi:unnamed protein product [Urochloa decumbens]|uniref:Knottin scorpion toxin-like domain-containing protein n=1 Tax=Urochloa decumbens TaxID=240449 RepID=A0ABC8W3H9_9POAL
MEPSLRKNLSAAAAAVLLLVLLTAESSQSSSDGCNEHLSGSYSGACFVLINDGACNKACIDESIDNISGSCNIFQCWCYTSCHSKTVAPAASTPILP